MTYNQVIAHFGGLSKAAQGIGSYRQLVHTWKRRKRIPTSWQIKIEGITGLKADGVARCTALEMSSYLDRARGNGSAHAGRD